MDVSASARAATVPTYYELRDLVAARYPGAYCAGSFETGTCLIIVPARTAEEAAVGSGILSIGETEFAAWSKGAELVRAETSTAEDLRGQREQSQPLDLLNITVAGGKYRLIQSAGGGLRALRYGEEWRDLVGDSLVLAMAQEIEALRDERNTQRLTNFVNGLPLVELDYTNHRGERSIRWVAPTGRLVRDPDHHDSRWAIEAVDVKRAVTRAFDPANIHRWTERPGPDTLAEVPDQIVIPDTGVRSYIPEGDLTERMHFMVEAALQDGFKPHEDADELDEQGGETYVATGRQIVGFALRMLDSGAMGTGRIMALVNGKTAIEQAAMVTGPGRFVRDDVDYDRVASAIVQPDPVTSESYLPVLIGATVARTAGTEFYPRPLFLNQLAAEIHRNNAHWWSDPATGKRIERNVPEMLMLMVSEISEGLEGYRKNLMDDKLTHRPMLEVEIADLFIRGFDLAGGLSLDLDGAIAEKRLFNSTREDHKAEARLGPNGKKF